MEDEFSGMDSFYHLCRPQSSSPDYYLLYLSSSFLQPDGCPDLCNGNGRCTLGQNSWQCICQTGWRGSGCNVAMETSCADNKDNEGGEQKSSIKIPKEQKVICSLSIRVIYWQKCVLLYINIDLQSTLVNILWSR